VVDKAKISAERLEGIADLDQKLEYLIQKGSANWNI
jgi:hypothetical protein